MSRRKIKTDHSLAMRKQKRYLYGQSMNDGQWQWYCQKEARKARLLKRAMEAEKLAKEKNEK